MPLHVAGHRIGPVLVRSTVGQHGGHALGILAQQRVVAAGAQCQPQRPLGRVQRHFVEAVIRRHPGATVADQPGFLEFGQVRGHPRLRQAGDGRQLGHGEFFLLQQGQQADSGGVGEYLQACRPVFQIHEYLYIAIWRYFRPGARCGQLHTHANGWRYNGAQLRPEGVRRGFQLHRRTINDPGCGAPHRAGKDRAQRRAIRP